MALLQARDMRDFLAAPMGRYVTGASFVIAVQPERLAMIHLTPALASSDVADLLYGAALPMHASLGAKYDMLHDASAVRGVDAPAHAVLDAWLERWIDQFATRVRRVALVHPAGIAGAAFVGMFHDWVAPRFDARLCTTRADAHEFLAVAADERHQLDHVVRNVGDPLLRSVREALANDPRDCSIELVARLVGTSTRSLQRALTTQGTTFRREVDEARARVAQQQLSDTDIDLETIARGLGFKTCEGFVRLFKRIASEHPHEFRARFRARS